MLVLGSPGCNIRTMLTRYSLFLSYLILQENATSGTCDVPRLSPPPPAALPPESVSQSPSSDSSDTILVGLHWLIGTILLTMLLCWS